TILRREALAQALAPAVHAVAGLFEEVEGRLDRLAIVVEMRPALVGDGIELLVPLGGGGHVAGLLEEGEGGINDARAGRVKALRLLLDGLDQVVAVPRLPLDEIERDEPQVAAREHAADTDVFPEALP